MTTQFVVNILLCICLILTGAIEPKPVGWVILLLAFIALLLVVGIFFGVGR